MLPKREFDRVVEEEPRYYRHFAALGLNSNNRPSCAVKLLCVLCKYEPHINQCVTFMSLLPLYYYNGLESLAVTGLHQIHPSQYRHRYRLQTNA